MVFPLSERRDFFFYYYIITRRRNKRQKIFKLHKIQIPRYGFSFVIIRVFPRRRKKEDRKYFFLPFTNIEERKETEIFDTKYRRRQLLDEKHVKHVKFDKLPCKQDRQENGGGRISGKNQDEGGNRKIVKLNEKMAREGEREEYKRKMKRIGRRYQTGDETHSNLVFSNVDHKQDKIDLGGQIRLTSGQMRLTTTQLHSIRGTNTHYSPGLSHGQSPESPPFKLCRGERNVQNLIKIER